jgi:hypothetical protein
VNQVTQPWEVRRRHFTHKLKAFAVTLMREISFKQANQIFSENDSRMWHMLFSKVKVAHARLSFDNVVLVGPEEINRPNEHNYLTLLVDLMSKSVLSATTCKDASVCEDFATKLLLHNGHPKAIQYGHR